MDIKIYTFLLYILALAYARGPHHPRGERVVRRHVHYKPSRQANEKLTEDVNLLHDKEHIQEHLEDLISEPDLSKMTDEELEFYYFQVHDSDKNSKLDGLEILQAILHTVAHEDEDVHHENENKEQLLNANSNDLNYYIALIDQVLNEDDIDMDGYLSYSEYVAGRRQSRDRKDINRAPVVRMIP
ncbi:hypothetical protein NQ314_001779 [Rhamnusium bicolor]|uniref:Multiple coagulation factor deficiency protein 2 homolog n=1 Tax=Rhamnusium bicolor TaxID=1586634 RepID=A0AAV8ZR33_9CUCU|nr:hypothetical protein NQ314_001779 [Rhamnusium bicolor]